MKKIYVFLGIITCCSISQTFANTYTDQVFEGKKIRMITYDLNSKTYKLKVAVNPNYQATNLRTLMESNNAVSAVNGVFLCPADYSECGGQNFTKNERYVEGKKIAWFKQTGDRVVFALDQKNKAFLFQSEQINPEKEEDIFYGLANFPALLYQGEDMVPIFEEKGLVDKKMKTLGTRNFVCSDKNNTFIKFGFVYNTSIPELPSYLKKLECYNALNLDAGLTSAFIYNGKQLIYPKRQILDALVIEQKGVDVQKLQKLGNKVVNSFNTMLENKTPQEKLIILETIHKKLKLAKTKKYDKYIVDIYDSEGKKVGYKIKETEAQDTSLIYVFNILIPATKNMIEYQKGELELYEQKQKQEEEREKEQQEGQLLF